MGTIGTTQLVYGSDAELIENGNIIGDGENIVGETDYNYDGSDSSYGLNYDDIEFANAVDTDTESVSETTTTTTTISATPAKTKKPFDVVPMIVGGAGAYAAHSMFATKKYSWAYVLVGFTAGYFVGGALSKAINK